LRSEHGRPFASPMRDHAEKSEDLRKLTETRKKRQGNEGGRDSILVPKGGPLGFGLKAAAGGSRTLGGAGEEGATTSVNWLAGETSKQGFKESGLAAGVSGCSAKIGG